jgi:hypothetical protein
MFSNKFTLIFYLVVGIVLFLYLFKYLGDFMGREHFTTNTTNTNKPKNDPAAFNIVYNTNGGYPSDGHGPEIYVNNRVKNKWSEQVIKDFVGTQATQNPDVVFDMDMIQLQATQAEAEELIKTGMWPWSKRTQDIYIDAISRNSLTKKGPLKSMNHDRTIYNEHAILLMIALSDKEGQFLIQGTQVDNPDAAANAYSGRGTYGVNSGLIGDNKDIIQCNKGKLERIHSLGNDGITGAHVNLATNFDYNQLPNVVKGFSFIKQPCNPCAALNSPAEYTCPFSLDGGKKTASFAWEKLWGLPETPIPTLPSGFPYWMN